MEQARAEEEGTLLLARALREERRAGRHRGPAVAHRARRLCSVGAGAWFIPNPFRRASTTVTGIVGVYIRRPFLSLAPHYAPP